MRKGQVIAIPVLTRHIIHSSGACTTEERDLPGHCVMADALRDRFPGAQQVHVSATYADFRTKEGYVVDLRLHQDTTRVINVFDRAVNQVQLGLLTLKQAIRGIREDTPRKVHVEVIGIYDRSGDPVSAISA